ncbi:hypothetical protein LAZ67_6003331 [Cordylochernes scorpioides]|uniref:CCHC-type domain-containing protein n=1 Tax=Cordylochernes scorpioides TaxID=51811 RepID=A0ABY6KP60_9ARAC|nr:hypothetical protein LAZ67_6003331 [Cordylochernes scorpioides]
MITKAEVIWILLGAPRKTIHESPALSEVEKFQYLVQSMRAGTRADRLVRSYPLTTENYTKVVKALLDRGLGIKYGKEVRWRGYSEDEGELPITIDQRLQRPLKYLRREVKGKQRLEYMREGFGESSQRKNYGQHVAGMHTAQIKDAQGRVTPLCLSCKGRHWIQDCASWHSMTVTKRMDEMRKVNACFRCLRVGHMRATCRTQIRCSHCRGPHHTALHLPRPVSMENRAHGERESRNTQEPQASTGEQEVALSGMHVRTAIPKALLVTARVRIVGPQGVGITVLALLDQGSQSSFVHQDLLHHLTVPVQKVNAQIYWINNTRGEHVKQMVSCSVELLTESDWTIPIKALVVARMTGTLPSRDLRIPVPSSWKALPLADPQFETSGRVDVILGADVYGSLLLPEFKYDEKTQLCAQKTRLGWIISGKLPSEGGGSPHMVYNIRVNYEENLDNILRRFWEVKEVPIRPAKSGADEFCEELYKTKVLVCPMDAARQKILWRGTSNEPMIHYRLNTVTYGTSPAPFLALRTLIQLAIDEGSQYPRAAEALRKETYVDDILTGAEDSESAILLREELICLLQKGGFVLKKWASNDPTILNQIPQDALLKKIQFDGAEVVKMLSLGWDPVGDYFLYSFQEPTQGDKITKRGMLSLVAKLYDPMGWLAPLIVIGKIMIQRLWVAGKDWDAPIDGPIKEHWKKFREQLGCLRTVRIPRWLGLMGIQDIQLHGFSDASEDAYAAAVYIRINGSDGIRANLVAAKTRLAPVRRISIPRLELCAAVLLTRLITHILTVMRLDLGTIVCWTDATIVLAWIKTIA